MVYDFQQNDEIPSLESFKVRLARQMMRSAFFQHEPKEAFDMLKVPLIIAPKLLKQQVNSDNCKETLFNQKTNYGPATMTGLSLLIAKGEIDILNLDSMSPKQAKKVSKALKLKGISRKSNIGLVDEIKFVSKMYVAGQGNFLYKLS